MRRLVPLVVLMLAALLAWLVVSGSADGPAPTRDAAVEEPADPDEAPRSSGSGAVDREPAADGARRRKHATAPEPTAAAQPEEKQRRFTLRVLDGYDRPVPGVPVILSDGSGGTWLTTRSDGTAHREVGEDVTSLRTISELFDPVTLTAPETLVILEDLIPLEIDFVDQETGQPLEVMITGSPLESDNVLSYMSYSTYRAKAAPVRPGREARFALEIGVPDGYASIPGGRVERSALVSRYAERARTTVPIAREIALRVQVLRHDGTPAEGATITASVSGATPSNATATASASGEARLEDLPFLRGEQLSVHASDGASRIAPTQTLTLVDADREIALELTLPEEPEFSTITLGGGAGGAFSGRSSRRKIPRGTGRLSVAVTRRNGLPASHAYVFATGPVSRNGRTDGDGRIAFDGLPAGQYSVTLREPGLVATSENVELVDGEARTIAVRESTGRAATVRVLDHDGLPLPNVRLVAELPWGREHVQLVDGVQDLDHWTDLSGRFRFVDLPATGVTIRASLGSRSVEGKLDGDSLDITLPAR